jgi:hydrogenase-4 component B
VIVTPHTTFSVNLLPILWVAAVLLLAAASGAACLPRLSSASPVLSTAGSIVALMLGGGLLTTGSTLSGSGGHVLGLATFAVSYDGLSGAFLVALGASAAAASFSVVGARPRSAAEGAAYPLFLASILIVLGASNAFSFLLAWEAMALLSAFLVVGLRPTRAVVSAGNVYLALTHVATAAILIGFAVLAGSAGGRFDFAAWHVAAPGLSEATRNLALVLVFVGFATKAGAMPFHIWLPRAHPVAPSHVSAVMSGIMIKTGIYGLIRITIDVVGGAPDWLGLLILAVGAISAVMGVLYALMQHDIKRLLAFHSIENIGIILIGVGAAVLLDAHGAKELAALALAAAIFHSINHAVFKSLLFIAAGAVVHATGLRDLNHLGGLGRKMPVTMLAFGIGAAAISGLPPLNGFASEWLTFQGLLGAAGTGALEPIARFAAAGAIGALALTAALAVACFVKATGITFLGLPRSAAASAAHEATRSERGAMAALAAACVVIGLAAGPIVTNLTNVARSTLHIAASAAGSATATAIPAITSTPRTENAATYAALWVGLLLVATITVVAVFVLTGRSRPAPRRVDTWTCGIAPEPAFQYTATSYSQLVRLFFRRILVPQRTVQIEYHQGTSFPSSIRYRSRITMLLEERLLRPAHGLSLRGADFARKLQGGAIQLYIAYSVVAVLLLLLWARWT